MSNPRARISFVGHGRQTTSNGGGHIVADWPTHKVKQRRKRQRRRWLLKAGLLSYARAEQDRQRGLNRDVGIV